MGYVRSAYRLEWPEDSEFSGLVVRMKRLSIKQLMRIEGLSELRRSGDEAEVAEGMDEIAATVAGGLLGWNLEEEVVEEVDGAMVVTKKVPVPATLDGVRSTDLDLVMAIVRAWTRAASAVPLASPPSSPSGEPAAPDEWSAFLASEQQSLPSSPAHASS